jgi:hypothetical protein
MRNAYQILVGKGTVYEDVDRFHLAQGRIQALMNVVVILWVS